MAMACCFISSGGCGEVPARALGGEVRLGTDDRVVHPVLGTEIADIAVAGVDANADLERDRKSTRLNSSH